MSGGCWLFEDVGGADSGELADGSWRGGLALTPTGGIALSGEERSVRQSILMLLQTRPGERVMRPQYGCHLHRLVFAPNDANTAGLAIHYVEQALRRWEPRISIVSLDAGIDLHHCGGDPARLDIVLVYRLQRSGREGRLDLSLDLHQSRLASPSSEMAP